MCALAKELVAFSCYSRSQLNAEMPGSQVLDGRDVLAPMAYGDTCFGSLASKAHLVYMSSDPKIDHALSLSFMFGRRSEDAAREVQAK